MRWPARSKDHHGCSAGSGRCLRKDPITAKETEVFYEIYQKMKEHSLNSIPIVDDERRVIGILTLLDLLRVIFEGDEDPIRSRTIECSIEKIRHVVQGQYQHSLDFVETLPML